MFYRVLKSAFIDQLADVGIDYPLPKRLTVGTNLFPEDNIIEERHVKFGLAGNDLVVSSENPEEQFLLYSLATAGFSTAHAKEIIASKLNIVPEEIMTATEKEAEPLTYQFLTLPRPDIIPALKTSFIRLDFKASQTKALNKTEIIANAHTYVLRLYEDFEINNFELRLDATQKYGILNFFPPRLFGDRLINHKLGKLLLQGQAELALRFFLFKTGRHELPIIIDARQRAEKFFPDFTKIIKVFSTLPYSFSEELEILNELASGQKAEQVLKQKGYLVERWLFCYNAWCFNRMLSKRSREQGIIDEQIPLLSLVENNDDYKDILLSDEVNSLDIIVEQFQIKPWPSQNVPGRLRWIRQTHKFTQNILVLQFELLKHQLPDMVINHLFDFQNSLTTTAFINHERVDAKQILGQGSILTSLSKSSG